MNFLRFIAWPKFSSDMIQNEKEECLCKSTSGFFITKRQASIFSSLIIFLLTVIFIFGYFWGQQKVVREFTNKLVTDSFADQVNYSMYSIYGENSPTEQSDLNDQGEQDQIEQKENEIVENKIPQESLVQSASNLDKKEEIKAPQEGSKKYYAQLIGFGSESSAKQFVNKVQKKGYNLNIVPRKSRSSRGRTVTWYQVITEKFDDLSRLNGEIAKLKNSEKLHDIKIITE